MIEDGEEPTLQPGTDWLGIRPDDVATGPLIDKCGDWIDPDELPLSMDLKSRLDVWFRAYDFDDDLPRAKRGPFDTEQYGAEGLAIAQALKRALPDFTINYFDIRPFTSWSNKDDSAACFYDVEI